MASVSLKTTSKGGLRVDTIIKLLQDPIWQSFGVMVTVIALAITIVIYFKQRTIKRIAYRVISDAPILSIEKGAEDIGGEVEVIYKIKKEKEVNGQTATVEEHKVIKVTTQVGNGRDCSNKHVPTQLDIREM